MNVHTVIENGAKFTRHSDYYSKKDKRTEKKNLQILAKGKHVYYTFANQAWGTILAIRWSGAETFQLFPNENSNRTPFRQFQPGDLDKENLQRPVFGDPLDKLRPPEGTKPYNIVKVRTTFNVRTYTYITKPLIIKVIVSKVIE